MSQPPPTPATATTTTTTTGFKRGLIRTSGSAEGGLAAGSARSGHAPTPSQSGTVVAVTAESAASSPRPHAASPELPPKPGDAPALPPPPPPEDDSSGSVPVEETCDAAWQTAPAAHKRRTRLLIAPLRVTAADASSTFPASESPGAQPLSPLAAALPPTPTSAPPVPAAAASPTVTAASATHSDAAASALVAAPSNLMYSERESELIQDIVYFFITRFPEVLNELFEKVGKDRIDDFVSSVVTLTFGRSATLTLLRYFVVEEFKRHSGTSDASNVLFRENGVASKILKAYLQKVGAAYLRELLSDLVTDVCVREQKITYEIDPGKLEDDEEEAAHNRDLLLTKVEAFVKRITAHTMVNKMPQGIRVIAAYFDELTKQHSPEKSSDALIGSFLMLRYINPAIMSPDLFGLLPTRKAISSKARRKLLLITKVLQNMSNGVPFTKKEAYMVPLNQWLDTNTPRIRTYFHEIVVAATTCSANLVVDSDLCVVSVNDLHLIHQSLFSNKDAIMGLVTDDDAKRELATKLDMLGTYSRKISFANALGPAEQAHVRQVLARYREEATFVSKFALKKKKKVTDKILVVGLNRIFLVRKKPPVVPGSSLVVHEAHVLDLQEIRSPAPSQISFVFRAFQFDGESDQADEIITCIMRAYLTHFSSVPREQMFKINVVPPTRVEEVVVPGGEPCGGFAGTYRSLCNFYGAAPNMAMCWDIENLYSINTTFDLKLFFTEDSQDTDLIPVFHALRYNTHFKVLVDENICKIKTPAAASALCELLRCNSTLTSLTLANAGLSERAFVGVFDAMTANPACAILHLNLQNNELEDRSATALGRYITECASRSGLISLNVQNAIPTPRAMTAFASELCKAAKAGPPSIQQLDISRNKLGDSAQELGQWFHAGAAAVRNLSIAGTMLTGPKLTTFLQCIAKGCKSLETLDLSNLRFTKQEDMLFVSQLLFLTTSLREVNLSGSVPTMGALQDLLSSGKPDASIHANLSCNNFSGDGVRLLHDTMPKMQSITSLDLSDTDLGDDGIFQIAEGLSLNTSIRLLNINGCFRQDRRPRTDTIRALCKLASSDCPLETLMMAGGPKTTQQLGKAIVPFLQSLIANKTLTMLDVSGHHFGTAGTIALSKMLQLNTTLSELQIDQNDVGAAGLLVLSQALAENKSIMMLPLPVVDISLLLSGANAETQKKVRALCIAIEHAVAVNNSR